MRPRLLTLYSSERLVRTLSQLLLVTTCLLALGCARLTSIYRSENVSQSKPQVIAIDAKQRLLLTAPEFAKPGDPPTDNYIRTRFCAEPPPDVFTALAASLGVEASVSKSVDPTAALKLAASISENASTIERSQTVNILREAMYRNCERYLNGAISPDEFIVQAARDQQLIVQVLAIEQITGAARAQATALTTVAKAAASGVTDVGLETLAAAKKDLEAKRAASDKAVTHANGLVPVSVCAAPLDPAAPPAPATAANVTAKNEACGVAKVALERTAESLAYLATVQQAVTLQSEVSASAQGSISSAALSAATVSEAVAKQVVEIVKENRAFDEIGMTCVIALRRLSLSSAPALPQYCKDLLEQMARTRQAQLQIAEGFDPQEIERYLKLTRQATQSRAKVVWDYLIAKGGITSTNVNNLAPKRIPVVHVNALVAKKSSFPAFAIEFGRMPPRLQTLLVDATSQ